MRAPRTARLAPALAGLVLLAAAPAPRAAPPGSPWGAAYFPDVELLTHDGRTVRFYSDLVKDRRVVVSFVYTRCVKACGLITANLARVQRELGDRVGKDVHFLSVSLDPERDRPEALAAYAAAFKAGPGWTFLTGRAEDVALLRRKLGDVAPVEEHAPRVSVGDDRTGTWWSTTALDDPRYLAMIIAAWMDPRQAGGDRVAGRGYSAAQPMARRPPGEAIFRQRCAACHVPGGRSVGPDLRGTVALRDRAWLRRWLKEPDRVLAERDPLALELLARHGNVPMPNLGLTDREVDEVVGYLEAADAAAETERAETR